MLTLEQAEADEADGKRVIHTLKTWPAYFAAIERGDKLFEVRRDDRGFQKGDVLNLVEYDPQPDPTMPTRARGATGNAMQVEVTYVLTGGQFGIEPGHVVMGIRHLATD